MATAQKMNKHYPSCGHEIYPGERIYLVDDLGKSMWMCPDCFRDFVRSLLRDDAGLNELAARMELQTEGKVKR